MQYQIQTDMNQLQKYTWLIETIRRAGKITLGELSDKWERAIENDEGAPLPRATFNRWKDAVLDMFDIRIACQRTGGYLYYIENPEDISQDRLKKWMLDTFAVGSMVGEHLSLKEHILVNEIPSGRMWLTVILSAIKEKRVLNLTYRAFDRTQGATFPIAPYCVRLFENRWYAVALNIQRKKVRTYALDRMENLEATDQKFRLPSGFSASSFFSDYYGIVTGDSAQPTRIVLRANESHKHYLTSLPLHHSQKLIEDCGKYADFELNLAPTYDFVMKLLSVGSMVEVLEPLSLRKTMKGWVSDMYELYKND